MDKYYVVAHGPRPGVYTDYMDVQKQLTNFRDWRVKSYKNIFNAFAFYLLYRGIPQSKMVVSNSKVDREANRIKRTYSNADLVAQLNTVNPNLKSVPVEKKPVPEEKEVPAVTHISNWIIYTDGHFSREADTRAYAAVLYYGASPVPVCVSGNAKKGEAFEMEVLAIIKALKRLTHYRYEGEVHIYSDCLAVVNMANETDKGKQKKLRKKMDTYRKKLWKKLLKLKDRTNASIHWVKGHSGNEKNRHCDQLANLEALLSKREVS